MNNLRPTNKGLIIFFLGVLALYAAYIKDTTTVSLIAGGFIALLRQED